MKKRIITVVVLCFFVLAAACLAYFSYKIYTKKKAEWVALQKKKAAWEKLKNDIDRRVSNFKGSVGLIIKDLDTGWQIDYNKDTLFPSASLVKIPIMLAYFYSASDGNLSLKDQVVLKLRDKVPGSKALGNDPAGSKFAAGELLSPMITLSDNTAANALIDFMGFDMLNAYFHKIGLKNTNLSRRMMDFRQRSAGVENYTTAEDMAYMLEQLYYGRFLNKDVSNKCLEILGEQKINDRIPRRLPKGICIAHKTGLERHICHDVGVVYTNDGDFLICVLVRHNNKFAQPAKKFISSIAVSVYDYYNREN